MIRTVYRVQISKRNLSSLGLVLLAWTAFGVFFGTQDYVRDAYFGKPASLPGNIVSWIICGYSWGLLTYPVLLFARRYSLERLRWPGFLLVHIPAAFFFAALQLGVYLLIATLLFNRPDRTISEFYKSLLVSELQTSVLVYFVIVSAFTAYSKIFKARTPEQTTDDLTEVKSAQSAAPLTTSNGNNGYTRRFPVKENGKIVLVDTDQIDWIESYGNYLFLHTAKQKHIYRETMTAMETKLDPEQFVRIRRSTIVRIEQIKELHPTDNGEFEIVLSDGTVLVSTRRYRKNLEHVLKS